MVKPASLDTSTNPRLAMTRDRTATLVRTIWMGIAGSTALILVFNSAKIVVALLIIMPWWPLSGAWVNYTLARIWFTLSGKAPWRVLDFLEDAHQRGVLRQVGAAYEFRHQRLQEYLTSAKSTQSKTS